MPSIERSRIVFDNGFRVAVGAAAQAHSAVAEALAEVPVVALVAEEAAAVAFAASNQLTGNI